MVIAGHGFSSFSLLVNPEKLKNTRLRLILSHMDHPKIKLYPTHRSKLLMAPTYSQARGH